MRPAARRFLRRAGFAALAIAVIVAVAALGAGLWLRSQLRASLARLDGEIAVEGLSAPVVIERDDLGVPTIRGASRVDVAHATGFLHAQERFFQMDLLRRAAAGELAELVGPALLANDRAVRVHRFRAVAERNLALASPERRRIIDAYTEGVNDGLAALGAAPPEHLALRSTPEPWRAEDIGLVVLAMYLDLQGDAVGRESNLGVLYDVLPGPLADFLAPRGCEWDAPLVGEAYETPPIPPPTVFDLRQSREARGRVMAPAESLVAGSNNWAIDGAHAADGAALLANDMHLPLRLPNVWYRASLVWPDERDASREHRVTGVTLPGAPPIIAGSNGHVAWGFTNSQGDWSDLVILETDAPIETFEESIAVKGGSDEPLAVRWTVWGPVIDEDHRGRPRAQRWIAHDPDAVDLGLLDMELAHDVEAALETAARARIPTQNCVVADSSGRIGWTLMGPIPRRFGHDGRTPRSWAAGDVGWNGLLAPEEYPRIVDPAEGRIWTANNRVVDGEMLERIGDGGYALGARAKQIRDGLRVVEAATPRDMLALQLDDRALLLERWRELLLEILDDPRVAGDERRAELRQVVREGWTGRASIDSAAYRIVRAFRLFAAEDALGPLTAECREADDSFDLFGLGPWECPLWRLVRERPAHLLDPRFDSWESLLLATVDRVIERLAQEGPEPLAARTWGARNTVRIQHPLSLAVPRLGRWLDIAPEPLPGDSGMPRVQGTSFGASERFVVSPGREEAGIFHMPGGQSGHFLSPHYRAGHDAWARGEPSPFLPGPTTHRLTLGVRSSLHSLEASGGPSSASAQANE